MAYKLHEGTAANASQKGLNDEVDLVHHSAVKEGVDVDEDTDDTEVGVVGPSHPLGV